MSEAMKLKSVKADQEIRERHTRMPDASGEEDADGVRRKRLIYRAKQRGEECVGYGREGCKFCAHLCI